MNETASKQLHFPWFRKENVKNKANEEDKRKFSPTQKRQQNMQAMFRSTFSKESLPKIQADNQTSFC